MSFEFSPICKQFFTIICCNLLIFSYGTTNGFATINLNELQSKNSTFSTGTLSEQEGALFISLTFIGSFVGNFIIFPISNFIGIKRTIHLFGLPLILSTLLILWAKNVYYLYVSRFLCGIISGGLVVGIPTLINEISNDNVRGALNSLYDPFNNSGTIFSFLLGNLLNLRDQATAQLIIPIIFMIVMCLLPESPEHWIKKRQTKRAIKSCQFYKGSIKSLENVEFVSKHQCIGTEYQQRENVKENAKENVNSIETVEFISKYRCVEVENHEKTNVTDTDDSKTLHDFLTRRAKRSIFIGFTSIILSFLSCATVMLNYITKIFKITGTPAPLTSEHSSLVNSIVQLIANIIFLTIVEKFNRKTLYVWSSIFTAFAFAIYGIYCSILMQSGYEIISLLCFTSITFISSMGIVPIPYILCVEIFPKKIRKLCLMLAVSMMWIVLFALDASFPAFIQNVPLNYCMFILAVISLLNAIFGVKYIFETRGKSYDEIMELLDS